MALLLLLQQMWQELLNVTLFNFFLISLVFFTSITFLHKFIATTKGPKLNLPPSPPKLPIIGNLHQLGTFPHRSLQALSKKYGPIMSMGLGYIPTVVISSAEVAKEMTKSHDLAFSNRPKTTGGMIFFGCEDVGFTPYNEYWKKAKKVCVHELLTPNKVQSFQFVREEEVASLIERVRSSCRRNSDNNSVNMSEILMTALNNIVSRCVLGQHGNTRMAELSRKLSVQFMSFSFGDFFPYLGWIDELTGLIPRMKETSKELHSYFDEVIEEHKILKNRDENFLDILLQLQSDDSLDFVLTQERLKGILLDMIAAGSESSLTTTEWIMTELARNPTILKKVQEEVRRVVGEKSEVEKSDIERMGYLQCVIKEGLRLHGPAPLMAPRETMASVTLEGYDIPNKTRVIVNTWAIQRDSQIWGDRAEEFIPERFENNPVDFKGQDFEFIPFGVGRRGCPGILFAAATIEYVIANILYWFDWALPDGITPENLDMSEVFGLTAHKKNNLYLVPTLYSP